MNSREHSVTIVRTIKASAGDVYKAWTEPAIMKRWLAKVVEADVQVGGAYRLESHEHGVVKDFAGEYVALETNTRVVQTFRLVGSQGGNYTDELLDIRLDRRAPELTELTLINSWNGSAMSDAEKQALVASWNKWLDRLVAGVEVSSTLEG